MKLMNGGNKIKMIFECHAKRQRKQSHKETILRLHHITLRPGVKTTSLKSAKLFHTTLPFPMPGRHRKHIPKDYD